MERYQFEKEELAVLESSCIPLAAYQFLNPNVVTLALSQGFLDLFGYESRAFAYELMDANMYRDTHPDDVARVTEEAVLFAKNEKPYNVIYRTRRADGYHIIHAFGRHEIRPGNVQIAFVWYVDEGLYRPESGWSESGIPVIREFTNDLQNESGTVELDHFTDNILHTLACKAAVKAGQALSQGEIDQLLAEYQNCTQADHCPHGRPSVLIWSCQERDKLYGRLGQV